MLFSLAPTRHISIKRCVYVRVHSEMSCRCCCTTSVGSAHALRSGFGERNTNANARQLIVSASRLRRYKCTFYASSSSSLSCECSRVFYTPRQQQPIIEFSMQFTYVTRLRTHTHMHYITIVDRTCRDRLNARARSHVIRMCAIVLVCVCVYVCLERVVNIV